jgi:hypothetical protein
LGTVLAAVVIRWQPGDLTKDDEVWNNPTKALQDYAFLRDRLVEEHGWDAAQADGAIVEYFRFLTMLAEAPSMELIASSDVDLVWHEHLLDTSNYAADTQKLFGDFLHHRRARTQEEFDLIPEFYTRTKQRYLERFGIPPPQRFWGVTTEASSMCGRGTAPAPPPTPPLPTTTTTTTTVTTTTTTTTSTTTTSTTTMLATTTTTTTTTITTLPPTEKPQVSEQRSAAQKAEDMKNAQNAETLKATKWKNPPGFESSDAVTHVALRSSASSLVIVMVGLLL